MNKWAMKIFRNIAKGYNTSFVLTIGLVEAKKLVNLTKEVKYHVEIV